MNGTMFQAFEWYLPDDAAHWKRLAAAAGGLAQAGFTAVWLPPAYKAAGGVHDVGYGVYDTYDLGEFAQKGSVPTKYGTRAEYLACIGALHQAGLSVLPDIVLNHRMGADACEEVRAEEVNGANRSQDLTGEETVRVWTKFTFPGRAGKYSDFTWDWRCFDGVDWDDAAKKSEVLLFEGKSWDSEVDTENGNYDYLMGADLDMGSPAVAEELTRWGKWYLDTTRADGFRLDAVKHINRDFYTQWLAGLRAYAGRELFTVGEYWSPEIEKLIDYLNGDGSCMSLFDVPLHYALHEASASNGAFDMRHLWDTALAARRPCQTVTFVDNHDTQPGQALQSEVQSWFKPAAYALILLREAGYPCVFYGDWYGIPHNQIPPVAALPALVALRAKAAYGPEHDAFDHPDIVGFTREGDAEHPAGLAVLLTNGPGGAKRLFAGTQHAGETWPCAVGRGAPVTIGPDGWADFSVDGGSLNVWSRAAL
ncbi:MAG: alpha-amylase [Faecalibacterium sp.]|jgi:alpha-amylase|nr:alpha-amylase [Faecalibacterium sp.]